jgi:predicted Zn-dependent peptidase
MSHRFDLPAVGPATPVSFPPAIRRTLDNGLSVRAINWPAVPAVAAAFTVLRGGAADPPGQSGLTALVADLLDEGAGSRDAIALAEAFALLGAHLQVEAGPDAVSLSFTTLSRHLPATLRLLADVLLRPHLDHEGLARVRDLRLSRLRQLSQTPAAPADRALVQAVFGGHPYAHGALGTTRSLQAITVDDVRQRWQDGFGLAGATLTVVGDVDPEAVADLVNEVGLGAPSASALGLPDAPPTPPKGVRRVVLVPRPGVPQSEIRVGLVAPPRRTDDFHALTTLNAVIGGQFTSRINRNLRETRGITYGARTGFEFRRAGGLFDCAASVQADATAVAVAEILRELADVRHEGTLTPAEIAQAKASLTRGYARGFETARQLVRASLVLVVYDLPEDTFDRFVPAIDAIHEPDLVRVARAHVDPDACAIVVVGDPSHADALKAFGDVDVREPEF